MTTWSPKAERELIANVAAKPRLRRRRFVKPLLGFLLMVVLPTAVAAFYYYTIAVNRYVSEFRYSVRGGAQMVDSGDTGGLTSGAAQLVFAGDSFVLEDYLASVQAFEDIEKRLPLREMLAKDGGDPVRGYDPDFPAENMLPFWESAVFASFDALTGITTVQVTMYSREDAEAVSNALIEELKVIVDGLTSDARFEMLRFIQAEYDAAKDSLDEARDRIRVFRETNRTISPDDQAEIDLGIEADLRTKLSTLQAELNSLLAQAPNSPRVQGVKNDIDTVERQLLAEYDSRGDGNRALAAQVAEFEELQEDYELARLNFIEANNAKRGAEANAMLNQANLVMAVKPRLPSHSISPDRPIEIATVFAFAFLIWLGFRVFFASLPTQ